MSRKEKIIIVPEWCGRDKGKHFLIKERNALDAERWGIKLALALKGTSGEIPDSVAAYGVVGVLVRGINAILAAPLDPAVLLPLLDELLPCIRFVRDPKVRDKTSGNVIATDIIWDADDVEEPRTVTWLRQEVLSLHVGFSILDELSKRISAILQHPASKSTPTSPPSSDTSSQADEPPLPN